MFDDAQRRNPDGARKTVVLLNGDEKLFDLIHVIHYLWLIAVLLCPDERRAADAWIAMGVWIAHILKQLLTRHPLDVVATIRQTATNRQLAPADREQLDAALEYLNKNSTRVHYARFLAEGLPIATGVFEGACRYLIQDRRGITGARWGLADAEAVLKLRAIHTSGDWNDYWRFHLKKEHARNHPLASAA